MSELSDWTEQMADDGKTPDQIIDSLFELYFQGLRSVIRDYSAQSMLVAKTKKLLFDWVDGRKDSGETLTELLALYEGKSNGSEHQND